MFDGWEETVSITTFRKLPFVTDFRIETEDGKVLSALRIFAPKWNTMREARHLMREARSRNIKGSALKSIFFHEKTYIHQSKFDDMQVCNLSEHVICEKFPFLHSINVLIKCLLTVCWWTDLKFNLGQKRKKSYFRKLVGLNFFIT